MNTKSFTARLEGSNYDQLKQAAAIRGISSARVLNDLLSMVLPQLINPEVSFMWIKTSLIGN